MIICVDHVALVYEGYLYTSPEVRATVVRPKDWRE